MHCYGFFSGINNPQEWLIKSFFRLLFHWRILALHVLPILAILLRISRIWGLLEGHWLNKPQTRSLNALITCCSSEQLLNWGARNKQTKKQEGPRKHNWFHSVFGDLIVCCPSNNPQNLGIQNEMAIGVTGPDPFTPTKTRTRKAWTRDYP